MDSRAIRQCNAEPYLYAMHRKYNLLAGMMVMQHVQSNLTWVALLSITYTVDITEI